MPSFVQFVHPGREHRPSPRALGTVMDWNTRSEHRRKFLRVNGSYLVDGHRQEGAFCFWGEWEAPSRVLKTWEQKDGRPRFLHAPLYRPPTSSFFQNTDPFVFGERFLYTNCRQVALPSLQCLEPGSVVVFGSCRGGGFVLDTVFVVGAESPRRYTLGDTGVMPENTAADPLIFHPLVTSRNKGESCVAYFGRMHDEGGDAPYSFVPCLPDTDDPRFMRPRLEPVHALKGLISPRLRRGIKSETLSGEELEGAWRRIVEVCREDGLAQGGWALPPEIVGAPTRAPVREERTEAWGCSRRGC